MAISIIWYDQFCLGAKEPGVAGARTCPGGESHNAWNILVREGTTKCACRREAVAGFAGRMCYCLAMSRSPSNSRKVREFLRFIGAHARGGRVFLTGGRIP